MTEQRRERLVGPGGGSRPAEPRDVGTFSLAGTRVTVGAQQEPDVEMLMTLRRGVHIEMHRLLRHRSGDQSGLLRRLPKSGGEQRLVRLDVTTRLDPDAESLVPVQQHASRSDDDRRRCYVDSVGMLVERSRQSRELVVHALQRRCLAIVDRPPRGELRAQQDEPLVDGGQVASASYGGGSPGCNGT
jgi:hypothetical protein